MHIAVGQLMQETNSFNPILTEIDDFVFTNERTREIGTDDFGHFSFEPFGFMHRFSTYDPDVRFAVLPIVRACSGGPLTGDAYTQFMKLFESELKKALPVDAVYLSLHGALLAEDSDDVEGDLLEQSRNIVGSSVPIVVSFDLHGLITTQKLDNADIITGYRTMPHCDFVETGERTAHLLVKMITEGLKPQIIWRFLPMILPVERQDHQRLPLKGILEMIEEYEKAGVIKDASIFLTQPWLDVADMHCAVVGVTHKDGESDAMTAIDRICDRLWKVKEEFSLQTAVSVQDVVKRVMEVSEGLVVIADAADATTSGSPGDSTVLLRELLGQGFSDTGFLMFTDPETVSVAIKTGLGKTIMVNLGGKRCPGTEPVTLEATVKALFDSEYMCSGTGEAHGRKGRSTVLQHRSLYIVVTEEPVMDPDVYRSAGLDPAHAKLVQAKAPLGFRRYYEKMAKEILIMDGRGAADSNFKRLAFKKRKTLLYPFNKIDDWKMDSV